MYKEIEGDLIKLALEGYFDVIAHGCNCFCTMGAGIAVKMKEIFSCNKYLLEHSIYKGDIKKLGQIGYKKYAWERHTKELWLWENILDVLDNKSLHVVNAYTQFKPGPNLDYEALTLCLRKINSIFKGKHVGLPQIGCGIAGGVWDLNEFSLENAENLKKSVDLRSIGFKDVKTIIQQELKDCDVTVVIYNK